MNWKRFLGIGALIVLCTGAGFVLGQKVQAETGSPGSLADPLASQSYVNQTVNPRVQELQAKIQQLTTKAAALEKQVQLLEQQLAQVKK